MQALSKIVPPLDQLENNKMLFKSEVAEGNFRLKKPQELQGLQELSEKAELLWLDIYVYIHAAVQI